MISSRVSEVFGSGGPPVGRPRLPRAAAALGLVVLLGGLGLPSGPRARRRSGAQGVLRGRGGGQGQPRLPAPRLRLRERPGEAVTGAPLRIEAVLPASEPHVTVAPDEARWEAVAKQPLPRGSTPAETPSLRPDVRPTFVRLFPAACHHVAGGGCHESGGVCGLVAAEARGAEPRARGAGHVTGRGSAGGGARDHERGVVAGAHAVLDGQPGDVPRARARAGRLRGAGHAGRPSRRRPCPWSSAPERSATRPGSHVATLHETVSVVGEAPRGTLEASELREGPALDVGGPGLEGRPVAAPQGRDGKTRSSCATSEPGPATSASTGSGLRGVPDPPWTRAFHVDFAEVDRVEVGKGPFDVKQPGLLSSSVNVVTRKPEPGWHALPTLATVSFGLVEAAHGRPRRAGPRRLLAPEVLCVPSSPITAGEPGGRRL